MIRLVHPPAVLFLCLPILVGACSSSKPTSVIAEPREENWKSCRIGVNIRDGVDLELIVTDKALIEKIAGEPLRNARIDVEPSKYRVLGSLDLERDGGQKESFPLFFPVGHYKRGGAYYITDFTEMKNLLGIAHESRDWKLLSGEK